MFHPLLPHDSFPYLILSLLSFPNNFRKLSNRKRVSISLVTHLVNEDWAGILCLADKSCTDLLKTLKEK